MTDAPPLDLNQATPEDLSGRTSLGESEIRALTEARPFNDWSDLKRVEGFDNDRITRLQGEGLTLGQPSGAPLREPGSGGHGGAPAGNLGRA